MHIYRLFETVYILLDKKQITARELAARFEVSPRTIYRDIETLSASGIPVLMKKGKGGGISLLPEFTLNKTVLTEEEKINILMALKATNSLGIKEADNAFKKLSSLFGKLNTEWVEVDFSSWSNPIEETEIFNKLRDAVIHKHVVRFSYASSKGESITREVEPLKLCFKSSAWYLYGYCMIRRDNRFFKLSRMKSLKVLIDTFTRSAPKDIFTQKLWDGEYITLKLKLPAKMSYRVYDEFDSFIRLEDGSFLVEIKIPKGEWVYNYIFSYRENCEVLEPAEIRNGIRQKLEQVLKNHL